MNEKQMRQLTAELAEELTRRDLPFLNGRHAEKTLLKNRQWEEGLAQLLPIEQRLTCAQVLDLCRPILEFICPEPPDGWLSFCYRYIREVMYPNTGFAADAAPYEGGAKFYLTVLQVLLDQERQDLPADPLVDFRFLSEEEYANCDSAKSYRRFLTAWREEYLYELMRLG